MDDTPRTIIRGVISNPTVTSKPPATPLAAKLLETSVSATPRTPQRNGLDALLRAHEEETPKTIIRTVSKSNERKRGAGRGGGGEQLTPKKILKRATDETPMKPQPHPPLPTTTARSFPTGTAIATVINTGTTPAKATTSNTTAVIAKQSPRKSVAHTSPPVVLQKKLPSSSMNPPLSPPSTPTSPPSQASRKSLLLTLQPISTRIYEDTPPASPNITDSFDDTNINNYAQPSQEEEQPQQQQQEQPQQEAASQSEGSQQQQEAASQSQEVGSQSQEETGSQQQPGASPKQLDVSPQETSLQQLQEASSQQEKLGSQPQQEEESGETFLDLPAEVDDASVPAANNDFLEQYKALDHIRAGYDVELPFTPVAPIAPQAVQETLTQPPKAALVKASPVPAKLVFKKKVPPKRKQKTVEKGGEGDDSVEERPIVEFPRNLTKKMYSQFAKTKVSDEAMEEVYQSANMFWKNLSEDLEALATHAGRKTISTRDFEVLFRRNGLMNEKTSLYDLVRANLPRELQEEIIPIAKANNEIYPKK